MTGRVKNGRVCVGTGSLDIISKLLGTHLVVLILVSRKDIIFCIFPVIPESAAKGLDQLAAVGLHAGLIGRCCCINVIFCLLITYLVCLASGCCTHCFWN